VFSKFEVEKLRKIHFEVFIQGKNEKTGVEKKHGDEKNKNLPFILTKITRTFF
jgi:hypothetical protein